MNVPRALMILDVQRRFAPPPQFLNRLHLYAPRFRYRIFMQNLNPPESKFRKALKQKCGAPGSAQAGLFDAGIECHRKENLHWSSSGLHKPARAIIREQFPMPR